MSQPAATEFVVTFSLRGAAGALYAVAVKQVETVLPSLSIAPVPAASPGVLGLINLRGAVLPVLDFAPWLGLAPGEQHLDDQIMVLRADGRRFGVLVAEVRGVELLGCRVRVAGDLLLPGLDHRIDGVVVLDDGLILLCEVGKFLASGGDALLASIPAAAP